MASGAPQLTDAEWTVMDAVWELAPVRARDVHGRVAPVTGWAYTTVKTLLTRLVEKGALRERRDGNAAVYDPLVSRSRARRSAFAAFVARAFGGRVDALIQHVAHEERLGKRDRAALRAMLDELDGPGGTR